MEKINLFDLIESYLDDTLPEEKRREVERRMAEDEAFRREVALHRGLQENFSDPGRWQIRSTLAEVMAEHPPPDDPSFKSKHGFPKWQWIWIIFFAIVLIGTFIWYLLQSPHDQPTRQPAESQPTIQPSIAIPGIESDTTPVAAPKESVPQKQQPEGNLLIAEADPADFIANPSMEAFVSSGSRSFEGLTLRMTSPANSAAYTPDKKGETLVPFAGILEGASDEAPSGLVLAIFNNKNITRPLLSLPLELKKESAGLAFSVRPRLKFPQGLYYLTIQQDGEMIYGGKFTIGKLKK